MTANQLMKLVQQRKSVVGFHWHRNDIRMPAAFVANMQFTRVMEALPRMEAYVPKNKHNTNTTHERKHAQ